MPSSSLSHQGLIFPLVDLIENLEQIYGRADGLNRLDPMEELVCCILSQHSTDARSFPAFDRLREAFPDWQSLVDAGEARIAQIVKDVGLGNQKARSIVGSLKQIKQETGSYSLDHLREMPMLQARAWLLRLPGVGLKTASIVLCFALGFGAIPVDTHVYRVSWRLGVIPSSLDENKAHDHLLRVVSPDLAFRYHVALIRHGRQVCRAPIPLCKDCVVSHLCAWYRQGGPEKAEAVLIARRKERKKRVKSVKS